mmetsp:Transcript_22066/g.61834  ORF Transcript_22066/g.61834 Transcript_22066/m.61834 type:complete len:611 (-) Transcript_22066:115-1947(-)
MSRNEWWIFCLPHRWRGGQKVIDALECKNKHKTTKHATKQSAFLEKEISRLSSEVARLSCLSSQLEEELARERGRPGNAAPLTVQEIEVAFDQDGAGGKHEGGSGAAPPRLWCCGDGEQVAVRQLLGIVAVLAVAVVSVLTEESSPMPVAQHRTLGILCFAVISWVCEVLPIPITGLMVGPLLFLCEVYTLKEALSAYVSNLTLILFGSYFIALAMERHGLDRRLATFVTSLRCIKGVAWRERLAMMLSGWILSMWVSNTGATNILVPITLRSMDAVRHTPLPDSAAQRTLTGSLLAVAYGCNSGGMGTLVGTPSNIVAQSFLEMEGVEMGFLGWMSVGVPASALVCLTAFLVLLLTYRPSKGRPVVREADLLPRSNSLGPITWGELVVAGSFLLTVFFWVFPSVYKLAGGPNHEELKAHLPAGIVVILGTLPLFLVPDRGGKDRVLPWSAAQRADWGIIMLVGGGVLLGKAMLATGLAERLAEGFISWTGVDDIWLLTFLVILVTIFATEICSNTATTNVMVPIVVAIGRSINPDPACLVAPVMGVALAASCAFMLPIATPPNYIVADTGHVRLPQMLQSGVLANIICAGVLWGVLRLLVPVVWPTGSD